jgi:hypothetical protein
LKASSCDVQGDSSLRFAETVRLPCAFPWRHEKNPCVGATNSLSDQEGDCEFAPSLLEK